MKAVKGNKVYTIDESEKARYIAMGYDITDGEKVVAYGKGKTVAYSEYMAVAEENEALKAELEVLKQSDTDEKKTTNQSDADGKKATRKTAKE